MKTRPAYVKFLGLVLLSLVILPTAWAGGKLKVLHVFKGGNDGVAPSGNLVFDAKGNLYGTTTQGGGSNNCNSFNKGCGTVFQLMPASKGPWKEQILYSFQNGASAGVGLNGSLVVDKSGNVYGTAFYDGKDFEGTVFELQPGSGGWSESIIYPFCSQEKCTDGANPDSGLILDSSGNLFGSATAGGTEQGGVAFELTPGPSSWTESVLFNFCPGSPCNGDGWLPLKLAQNPSGNLYGVTIWGGNYFFPCVPGDGCGAVFKLTQSSGEWKDSTLHRFTGRDGAFPVGGLVFDQHNNLYGATGGDGAFGCGTIFQLSPKSGGGWNYNTIYNLRNGVVAGTLAVDASGNLYGANSAVGGGPCTAAGSGEIFKLTPPAHGHWKYSSVYTFSGYKNGDQPSSGLIFDGSGNLYGTTGTGGDFSYGVVYEVTP